MFQVTRYYQENNQQIQNFMLVSQNLWLNHIGYTRNAIVSLLAELPDLDAINTVLMRNQEGIGALIAPYYTVDQVNTLVVLLKKHIMMLPDFVNNAEAAEERWRANGDDIVNHLQTINPSFWPTSITGPLWTTHLDETIAEINYRKNSMWDADLDAYYMNIQHINNFSRVFAIGVVQQFPDRFSVA